jgi:hypothetical protein
LKSNGRSINKGMTRAKHASQQSVKPRRRGLNINPPILTRASKPFLRQLCGKPMAVHQSDEQNYMCILPRR